MNLLLESIVANGLIFDAFGVLGLGVLALAALRLAAKSKSWGGSMMGYGAVALLAARVFVLLAPHFVDLDFLHAIGPIGITLVMGLPPILLTFGLAGVVWGLWGHEKWLKESC
ncbi:MAG: hypothetical protein ACSHX9_11080 [Luteolibacter sp.]